MLIALLHAWHIYQWTNQYWRKFFKHPVLLKLCVWWWCKETHNCVGGNFLHLYVNMRTFTDIFTSCCLSQLAKYFNSWLDWTLNERLFVYLSFLMRQVEEDTWAEFRRIWWIPKEDAAAVVAGELGEFCGMHSGPKGQFLVIFKAYSGKLLIHHDFWILMTNM